MATGSGCTSSDGLELQASDFGSFPCVGGVLRAVALYGAAHPNRDLHFYVGRSFRYPVCSTAMSVHRIDLQADAWMRGTVGVSLSEASPATAAPAPQTSRTNPKGHAPWKRCAAWILANGGIVRWRGDWARSYDPTTGTQQNPWCQVQLRWLFRGAA